MNADSYFCKFCKAHCNSKENFQSHVVGMKHRKMVDEAASEAKEREK
jgi:hypothetical protein